jgi:PleD family two-component response regulator
MLGPGATVDEWKKAADDALYVAKAAGRNRLAAA